MEIKIGRSSRTCAACEQPFVHDQELSSLVRLEQGILLREDYCLPCWEKERSLGAFSVWTPRFYDPAVAEQQPEESFSPLRRLFYDAAETEERSEAAVAFLAAQLLKRQKVFRLIKESAGEEDRITLYADRIGDRLIQVRDANFTYEELEEARKALLERLAAVEAPEEQQEAADDQAEASANIEQEQ
jgi:hypothetical protein